MYLSLSLTHSHPVTDSSTLVTSVLVSDERRQRSFFFFFQLLPDATYAFPGRNWVTAFFFLGMAVVIQDFRLRSTSRLICRISRAIWVIDFEQNAF